MRSKGYLLATILAALLTAATAPAQDIAYINLLQFDLQSFRSQATAGIFTDDVDDVGDAANLVNIEGNRLFTNFSNLNQPATLGDNILTYSANNSTSPDFSGSSGDIYDSGSYLVGWIGKYSKDSAYSFETFYQRNSSKLMFENLEDLQIGLGGVGIESDAEYTGFTRVTGSAAGVVNADTTQTFDLTRYDDRNAMNWDFGVGRDISEELTIGGRFFWENDQLDIFSEGNVETVNRTADITGALAVDSRQVTTYLGPGEEAFKNREIGVSLDADYHPWENQDINVRFDVFGSTLVNPGGGRGLGALPSGAFNPYSAEVGLIVDLRTDTSFATVDAGSATLGGVALVAGHENTISSSTSSYVTGADTAVQSVDDDRSGVGFAVKGQWDREWAGGENRAWLGFTHRGLDIDATAVAINRDYSTFWWNSVASAGDVLATNTPVDATFTRDRTGDMTLASYEIGTRWNRPMNENVSVGLGIILTRATQNETFTETNTSAVVTDRFDDGFGTLGGDELQAVTGLAAHNERQTELRSVQTTNVDDETRVTTIRLPVGGQFHFKTRWTVNVGAAHTIDSVERETGVTLPAAVNGPATVTFTDYSTPANNTVTYVDPGIDEDHTVTDKTRENHTTYWYGLSVMLTDAAQLDINGIFDTHSGTSPGLTDHPSIFDTDFYRSLALSLKYIFW